MNPIIDVHHHLYTESGYLDNMVKRLKELDIVKVCLNGLGEKYNQLTNESVAAAVRQYPDFILGLAHLRLDSATRETVDYYLESGFSGLKCINPYLPYDDEKYFPLYEAAEQQRMPILFHTGIVTRVESDKNDKAISRNQRPIYLDNISRTFPELKIIAAHIGSPWFDEAFMVARINPNVYLDLSSGSGWLVKGMGGKYFRKKLWWENAVDSILFATDVHYEKVPKVIKECAVIFRQMRLSREEQNKIYYENAKGIFKNI